MFTTKQSLTAGLVTTVGATFVGTFGVAPAMGAQLGFNFSTAREGTGSFTLDTSVLDSEPTPNAGLFQNAITNFRYEGARVDAPLDLFTRYDDSESETTFVVNAFGGNDVVGSLGDNQLFNFNLFFSGNIADDLPDDPASYVPLPNSPDGRVGFFGGYGGGFEIAQADNDSRITSVTVTQVPESSSIVGAGIALGFGALMQKQRSSKRQRSF